MLTSFPIKVTRRLADNTVVSEKAPNLPESIDTREFSTTRKGYDKREVRDYLEDLEQAFRELEGHARRTSQRVGDLERDLSKARATERVSVDNAMMAVFDAKDRILDRARRRADEIEEEAHVEAGRIREAAITDAGGAGGPAAGEIAAARAQADEIVAAARREADRMRNDAASDVTEDLEAELAALSAQVRRAHDDTAAVKEELDTARQRIVQLESEVGSGPSEDLEQKFAELEGHLVTAKAEADQLRQDLEARDTQVDALSAAVAAAEEALVQSKSYVVETESALDAKDAETQQLRQDLDKDRTELQELRAAQQDRIATDERLENIETELEAKIGEIEVLTGAAVENETALDAKDAETQQLRQDLDKDRTELQELRAAQQDRTATDERLENIETELEAKIGEIKVLTGAAAENETARIALDEELASANRALAVAEQNSDQQSEEIEQLHASQEAVGDTAEALVAVEAKLVVAEEQAAAADFVNRMGAIEATLTSSAGQEEATALVAEIARITEVGAADDDRTAELEAAVAESKTSLTEAKERIAALEGALNRSDTAADDLEEARSQAEAILAAARIEAEGIETEAEEQAEQRAARVIAKAREEADQVRQTVATLTAQAEDARSAALRSKLEAEDLAEAQRSISGARDDIVASAKSEAQELENEAEQVIAHARSDADRIKAESEERAESIVADARQKAEELITQAESAAAERVAEAEVVDDDDDLAALLAEAEQDVAISEGLRLQREELIQREQELVEFEQAVAAKHEEAALLLASARESAAATSGFGSSDPTPPAGKSQTAPTVDHTTTDPSVADSDDPAERLSALLEQVAPTTAAEATTDHEEPLDLDRLSEDLDIEPRARMAWPTPVNQDDSEDDADLDEPASDDVEIDDDLESDGEQRESRYRSRSAQLPRLGSKAKSNMTTMANLRKKSRGIND